MCGVFAYLLEPLTEKLSTSRLSILDGSNCVRCHAFVDSWSRLCLTVNINKLDFCQDVEVNLFLFDNRAFDITFGEIKVLEKL